MLYISRASLQTFLAPTATNNAEVTSQWNTVALAVGCGAGQLPFVQCFALALTLSTVGNAAQLACMKAVSSATLENAVIKADLGFAIVPDGKRT